MLPYPTPHFSVLCSLKADLPAVHGLVQKTTTQKKKAEPALWMDLNCAMLPPHLIFFPSPPLLDPGSASQRGPGSEPGSAMATLHDP